jgi:hypothetical protein
MPDLMSGTLSNASIHASPRFAHSGLKIITLETAPMIGSTSAARIAFRFR